MTSPKARRRQRSTRLTVAFVLVVAAAVLVAGALVVGASVVTSVAAVVAVVLGAAATRITHAELVASRRDAAHERAEQARGYLALAGQRAGETAAEVAGLTVRIAQREAALHDLEGAVIASQQRAAEASRRRSAEARRADLAERERATLAGHLEQALERVAQTVVQLALVEQETDALRAQLAAWQITSRRAASRRAQASRPSTGGLDRSA